MTFSWILDIITVAIIAVTVFFSVKHGFVKTAISVLSFAVALVITICFASPLRDALVNTSISDRISDKAAELVSGFISEGGASDSDGLINGEYDKFESLVSLVGIDREELSEWYEENVKGNAQQRLDALARKIAEPAVSAFAMLLSIIILFAGTKIVLAILAKVLGEIMKLPVLRTADKLLGTVLGVALALLRVCLFCFAVKILVENADFFGSGFISGLNPQSTLLFKLFYGINMFSFFI